MEGKYSALDVAKWFILHNKVYVDEGSADLLSNLKIQKLLYYAQGVFLAITNRPLFTEDIVAWQYGPVVEEVYHTYKGFGSAGITLDIYEIPEISKKDQALLKEVYDVFGQYSAIGLMKMTHSETPWKETPMNHPISLDGIKAYFKRHYVS